MSDINCHPVQSAHVHRHRPGRTAPVARRRAAAHQDRRPQGADQARRSGQAGRDAGDAQALQQQLFVVIQQIINEQGVPLSATERDRLAQEVVDEVFGLGPLEPLLKDDTISDILVNTYNSIYVERRGVLEKTTLTFQDNRHLLHIIDKIVSGVGRRVDESSPMVDARLPDGSRVNAIIPPLAVDGPILSIRRFGSNAAGRGGSAAQSRR